MEHKLKKLSWWKRLLLKCADFFTVLMICAAVSGQAEPIVFSGNEFDWVTNAIHHNNVYSNSVSPVSLQGGTNIVIDPKFTGTIQVGTNFYHLNSVTNYSVTTELVK
jgi:hypothetical protein